MSEETGKETIVCGHGDGPGRDPIEPESRPGGGLAYPACPIGRMCRQRKLTQDQFFQLVVSGRMSSASYLEGRCPFAL